MKVFPRNPPLSQLYNLDIKINNISYRKETFYLLNLAKYHDTLSLTVLTLLGNYKEMAIKSQLSYCWTAILEFIKLPTCINYLYYCKIGYYQSVPAYPY